MKNSRKNKKWMHLIALAIFVGVVACSMFMSSAATRTYSISSGTKFKHQIMVNSGNAFTTTASWSHFAKQKYGYMFAATGNPNSTSKDSEYFKLSGYFRY